MNELLAAAGAQREDPDPSWGVLAIHQLSRDTLGVSWWEEQSLAGNFPMWIRVSAMVPELPRGVFTSFPSQLEAVLLTPLQRAGALRGNGLFIPINTSCWEFPEPQNRAHQPLETWPLPRITAKEFKWNGFKLNLISFILNLNYGFPDFSTKFPRLAPSSSPVHNSWGDPSHLSTLSMTWSLYQIPYGILTVPKATGNPWCSSCCNHSANLNICFKDISRGEKWLYFIVKRQCRRQLISTIYFISSKPKYWYIWTNSEQGKSTFPKHSWTRAAHHKL